MALLQANDYQAFNEIYSRYRVVLYSYFSRLVDSSLAEELLQESFIKIVNKKNSFKFESKVKTWIWTIAKNTLRDHWRSVDHRMKNSFDSINDEFNDELESPLDNQEEALLKKVTQHQLQECINELPVDQKEIVLLHVQSELSNQEIADLTGNSVGAIKSVLFRTKDKLIECFKRGGHL